MYEKTLYIFIYFSCVCLSGLKICRGLHKKPLARLNQTGGHERVSKSRGCFFVIYVLCLSYFFVFSLQPCGLLLGKG